MRCALCSHRSVCELLLRCIVLPLRDLAGVVVGIYGRAIDRDQHLYLPGPSRGLVNAACAATSNESMITESVIDAMTFLEVGIMNAIPVYGVNGWTVDHDELLDKHSVRRIIPALDSDEADLRASAAITEKLLARSIDVTNVVLPAKDANRFVRAGGGQPPPVTRLDCDLTEVPVFIYLGIVKREDYEETHCYRGRDHSWRRRMGTA